MRVRGNLDVVTAFLLFPFIAALFIVYIGVSRDVLAVVVTPMLTAIGVFTAYRVNEKYKNPKLEFIQWGVHKSNPNSVRIYAEIGNAVGRGVARDARAIITIKKRAEVNLEEADLFRNKELLDDDDPLISLEYTRVEGEPIPWMIPEVPYQTRGLHDIELKHVTNIGPGQKNRATVLEVIRVKDENGDCR